MRKIFLLLLVIAVVVCAFLFLTKETVVALPGYKVVTREGYVFQVPENWILTDPRDFEGCSWDGVVNDGADGHRQNGEIGIYEKSCFDLSKSLGKQEVTEKDGYYIIAYYDKETGTTEDEIRETKEVYQNLVNTFSAMY